MNETKNVVTENKEELTNEEILNLVKEKFSDFERKYIIDLYKKPGIENGIEKGLGDKMHKILVGRASHLVKEMVAKGAMQEEIDKALEYLVVCIDCRKFNLDVETCYNELKIEKLLNKYDDKHSLVKGPMWRKRMLEIEKARKRIIRKNMQELKDEGFTNREIGMILKISEVAVKTYF